MTEWINAGSVEDVEVEDVIRFDYQDKTYAIYHAPEGDFYCTDGLCTHENVRLEDGLVMGHEIECPKHNAIFDYRTGKALRAPACIDLKTYPTKIENDEVWVQITP